MIITTTATLRPKILEQTFNSFISNLLVSTDNDLLIMNIDPVGELNVTPSSIVAIAKKYFKHVIYQIGDKNFARALKWCWSTALKYSDDLNFYFLNLEDDWLLLRYIDLYEIFKIMDEEQDLAILRFPFTDSDAISCKQWNKIFPYNGNYFECPDVLKANLGFSGHPSIIRLSFINEIVPLLNTHSCPEKQIKGHNPKMKQILNNWRFGVFSKPNTPKAIVDIGRSWREKNNFKKGNSYQFTTWEK